jgi:hypothetical protein
MIKRVMVSSDPAVADFGDRFPSPLKDANFSLGEGLTVVVGPSGSGKTALLRGVASTGLAPWEGGWTKPPRSTIGDSRCPDPARSKLMPRGMVVDGEWDGGPTYVLSDMVGSYKGSVWHIGDPGSESSVLSSKDLLSAGSGCHPVGPFRMKALRRVSAFLDDIPNIIDRSDARSNKDWSYRSYLESLPGGRPTVVIDDIDAGLDLALSRELWEQLMPELISKAQVVVSTKNVMPLLAFGRSPKTAPDGGVLFEFAYDAGVIELAPGFLNDNTEACRRACAPSPFAHTFDTTGETH